jgi:hypothetical protein
LRRALSMGVSTMAVHLDKMNTEDMFVDEMTGYDFHFQ